MISTDLMLMASQHSTAVSRVKYVNTFTFFLLF